MKIVNNSERIYDFGTFQVPPGRRGTVVPEGQEEMAAKIVAKFSDELEIADAQPPKPDARDEEIARLKAQLEAAQAPKVEAVKVEAKQVAKK